MNDQNQTITIKKYANRRLYNTATSTYVTLGDLSEMVKEGTKFNVYDAKSGDDITRSVLTQIIVEEESKEDQENLLPINFLRQLIGFYGNNMQWMVPKYLEHAMETLSSNQDKIRENFTNAFGNMFPFGTTLEEMSKQNMTMFENVMRMFSPMSNFSFNMNDFLSNMPTMPVMPVVPMMPSINNTATNTSINKTMTGSDAASSCSTTKTACCSTDSSPSKNDNAKTTSTSSCSLSSSSASSTTTSAPDMTKSLATVTDLMARLDAKDDNESKIKNIASTPMPNVQAIAANSGADDMQQKIANLQRQLADLAKSRA